ncbi:hypothetical protein D9611_013085 [Ephemerocybe angulata]|uniref:Transposase family Tnp2 protein n=1 Tax=Ephemerocybe angulata TaxID=980116 RepID=A0A8H5BZ87_9AGAR|nr:hypothetical protein D9611_013085 [Tulosesus angulatus]
MATYARALSIVLAHTTTTTTTTTTSTMPRYTEDPHAPTVIGSYFHPVKKTTTWWCNCAKYCKSFMHEISRTSFYRHNPAENRTKRPAPASPRRRTPAPAGVDGNGGPTASSSTSEPTPLPHPRGSSPAPEGPQGGPEDFPFGLGPGHGAPEHPVPQTQPTPMQSAPAPQPEPAPAQNTSQGNTQAEDRPEDDEVVHTAHLEKLKRQLEFIRDIKAARITDDIFPLALQEAVLKPAEEVFSIDDPDVELSLSAYLAISDASEAVYRKIQKMVLKRYPDSKMLSYEQIRKKVEHFSKVFPIISDMCVNTCVGFTSVFKDLHKCPECGEDRYTIRKGKQVGRRKFYTEPIGPVIQAMWRNPVTAKHMGYRRRKTLESLNKYVSPTGEIRVTEVDDITSGEDYLRCVTSGIIGLDDTLLMVSMDGAQLSRLKESDCWILIYVLMDLPPELRYKKDYVIPGVVIPGPKAPKVPQSFLYPGFAHVAALQVSGLKIWDASAPRVFTSKPVTNLTTADGPAMTDFNGFVGHKGMEGCREFCNLPGRRASLESKTYYPALLKPVNYDVPGSSHGDVDILNHLHNHQIPGHTQAQYDRRLDIVLASTTPSQYATARRDTGISEPSIFAGMHRYPPMPSMFPSDVMHLFGLNIPDNLLEIFRGTIACKLDDSTASWDFAVLTGDVWERHGAIIELWRPYFAADFGHVPSNPVKYINSGYRAQEFLIYIYDLLPAILHTILPETYWTTFCKLCAGIKIVLQRTLTREQIIEAHKLFVEFAVEFEQKFVQRKASRVHFVRPCLHNVLHVPSSTLRLGPHRNFSQYPMEREIGIIVSQIKQHTTPSGNASQRAIRLAQVNTVKALTRDEAQEAPSVSSRFPRIPAGSGYTILWPRERTVNGKIVSHKEYDAIDSFFTLIGAEFTATVANTRIKKWGRLELPSRDVVRSEWQESKRSPDSPMRITRIVKFEHENLVRFGEVQYYFAMQLDNDEEVYHLAMISMASLLDQALLEKSSGSLRACNAPTGQDMVVVKVGSIQGVVSALPWPLMTGNKLLSDDRWLIIENFGRDLSVLTESTTQLYSEPLLEDEDDDN